LVFIVEGGDVMFLSGLALMVVGIIVWRLKTDQNDIIELKKRVAELESGSNVQTS
jgi:hypothetical protein